MCPGQTLGMTLGFARQDGGVPLRSV